VKVRSGAGCLAIAIAVCAAAPAAASATDLYAQHHGSGTACTSATPCTLPTAVSHATSDGDRVILESAGGAFSVGSTLNINRAIDFGGVPGQPTPIINSTASTSLGVFNGGASFHDFRLLNPTGDPTLDARGGSFDRVFVLGGFFACEAGSGAVLRDSVCWGVGTNGAAMRDDSSGGAVTLRNVTVMDTASSSLGIDMVGTGPSITLNGTNVIARAGAQDVHAEGASTLTFANSNYRTFTQNGGATVTVPGTNGNQTASPGFANPAIGDFHEIAGSPTVDAGASIADAGATDLDGLPRAQGPCVGGTGSPDIGAYEFQPPRPSATCSAFGIGGVQRNKKKGTATLNVEVPGGGTLTAGGRGAKTATAQAAAAGEVALVLKASGKARKKLAAKHKLRLRLTISWSPTGNAPASQTAKVKLKKR
jgi:hypothetical protein